jgi:hypothetical protein
MEGTALSCAAPARSVSEADVWLDSDEVLMLATTTPQIAGELRDRQNWIGGNAYNPGRADFFSPPPEG